MKIRFLKRIAFSTERPAVFSIMRDEDYFLPFFLTHYRRLGLTQFLIYADRCSDSFVTSLMQESGVAVMVGDAGFGDSFGAQRSGLPLRLGAHLKITIPPLVFPAQWVLTVDADEFLVLPPPLSRLDDLIRLLEDRKQFFSFAPMVDFYPVQLSGRNHDKSLGPLVENRFFDRGPYHRIKAETGKLQITSYGVRGRLLAMLTASCPDELSRINDGSRITSPVNFKFPLIKNGQGIQRLGDHVVNAPVSMALSTALAHFKFYPGLDGKIATAISEGQYYRGSVEYKFLQLALERLASARLISESTV